MGIAGCKGAFTAFVLDAEIPAVLCKGELESLGAQLDFEKDTLSLLRRGVCVPLGVNAMGHYIVSVVEFGRGSEVAASYFEWSFVEQRPDSLGGGLHLPLKGSGLIRFAPPREFSVCTAVTSGDAEDDSTSETKKPTRKLHANWGHASATQLERVLVDSDGGISQLANHVDRVLETPAVCRAFDKAPQIQIAGTTTLSAFNEKVQVDLLFLGDLIVMHAIDVFSKYSLLRPAQSGNLQEVWDVFCAGWLGTFGHPKCIQMDESGEWANKIWPDSCSERRIKLQFQGVGGHPWLLGRRKGPARGSYNRLVEVDRFSNKTISSEVQWRLNATLSASGLPANQMVFASNPADSSGWEDGDEELLIAQDASLAGQFVQQWKSRARAQEATLKEVANSNIGA